MVGADIYTPGNTSDHLGVMGTYAGSFDEAGLPLDFSVRIGIRTSWIRPQNLQFNAVSAKFNQTEIGDGNLWTFSGSPTKIATYTEEKYDRAWEMGWMEKADGEDRWLGFTVGHAGATAADSWFDPKCADEGYMAQAFNSSAAGTPEWNYDTSSLEFNIFAPHLTSEGALNTGFFRLWVHESFAECQWPGNTLVTSDKLEAVILNEDGSTQDADLSVSKVNGVIYLDAGEIHYSVPKFIIKASNSQSTTAPASATPAVKLATTGANVEWMIVAGFLAVIAGSGFLALRRRKRIW
jgi:LPXTG-motif cell wall-anchored protein